jgi:CheY-like chemotaxis protein
MALMPAGSSPSPVFPPVSFDEHRRQALDSGMNDYLTKPLNLEALEQVLGRWI